MSGTEPQAEPQIEPQTGPQAGALAWRAGRVCAVSADDVEVWLFGDPGPVRLAGRGAGPLARAVDGRRDAEQLITVAQAAGMPEPRARDLLSRWKANGHLVPAPEPAAPPAVLLRDATGPAGHWTGPAQDLAAALRAAGMAVTADGSLGAAADETGQARLAVVLVDDLLAAADALSAVPGEGAILPTFVVCARGPRPAVTSPLGPGAGCAACLVARMAVRRSADLTAARRVGAEYPPPAPPQPAAVPALAGAIAAMASAGWSDQVVLVFQPVTATVTGHRVVGRPGCPNCDPAGVSVVASHLRPGTRAALVGSPRPDGGWVDLGTDSSGALRTLDPELTWARYAHLVSPVVGVVPEVVATGDPSLRAFSAGTNAAAAADPVMLRSRLRSVAGGKGLTLSAARTGALAEALERDSLRARGDEPRVRARMAELDCAIHPNEIQLFSRHQLDQAAALMALGLAPDVLGTGFLRVPSHFAVDAVHDWSAVTDITTGRQRWLPTALLWLGWPVPPGAPVACTNGAAAGNSVVEALLSGLMELVERDSVALWWYPRCNRPAFDLAGCRDPRILAALAPQTSLGTSAWVLDLTTDLGIPAAAAVATGLPNAPDAVCLGFGAHLDPVVAVVRALTELAQLQAPMSGIAGLASAQFPRPAEAQWFTQVTVSAEPWLAPHGLVPLPPSPEYSGVESALGDALDRLTGAGLDVLWADCTRPDLGLPVVRTWVPGLRHFWNRFAPGRLYDVPPALGWCDAGYTEADLNPRPMIL